MLPMALFLPSALCGARASLTGHVGFLFRAILTLDEAKRQCR
jgi:hypothetical protein